MKRLMVLFLIFAISWGYAQSQYTAQDVENTTDIKVVANFIKHNPNHPDIPKFKVKLYYLLNQGQSSKSTTSRSNTGTKTSAQSTPKVDEKTQKTVDLLNHLFSNEQQHSPFAYIFIHNLSSCPIQVTIKGKKSYLLDIPSGNNNFIKVDKGRYTLSSRVCEGYYNSIKDIHGDIEIKLNQNK